MVKGELRVAESVLLARAPYRFSEWRSEEWFRRGELKLENAETKRAGKTRKMMNPKR